MGDFVRSVLVTFDWAILGYFTVVNSLYLLLLVSAAWEMRTHLLLTRAERRWRVLQSDIAPTISVLAPAYNEAATIAGSVRALLTLSYPNLEVVRHQRRLDRRDGPGPRRHVRPRPRSTRS